ncbi:MAG: ParA family protein [Anaerolineae bacterium]|nr:ParA family protein [Anaerolineae bacterium]
MTETIVISNQKGGVAKTTSCLSLGGCLVEMGKTVLLIDLDPQANLTQSLGLKPEDMRRTIGDVLLGNTSMVSVSRESSVPGLDIIPASQELLLLDKILYGRTNYQFRLRDGLETMEQGFYDYVLVDCPSSLGTLTVNALTAAELLIIPIQCEYYASRTLKHFLSMVQRVQDKTNPRLTYRVLVTMYDMRNNICKVVLGQMQQGLKEALFETVIGVDTKLRESPAFGQPINLYAPNTRATEQYRALARELMDHGSKELTNHGEEA